MTPIPCKWFQAAEIHEYQTVFCRRKLPRDSLFLSATGRLRANVQSTKISLCIHLAYWLKVGFCTCCWPTSLKYREINNYRQMVLPILGKQRFNGAGNKPYVLFRFLLAALWRIKVGGRRGEMSLNKEEKGTKRFPTRENPILGGGKISMSENVDLLTFSCILCRSY